MAGAYIRTLRFKVKPESHGWLNAAAIEVNQVWNYANAASLYAIRPTHGNPKWLTGFDLDRMTSGASSEFDYIGAAVIQRVNAEYAQKRQQARKAKLRWRVSFGPRRSLGWVPFKAASIKRKGNSIRFFGKTMRVFESHLLDGAKWKQGCFAQDAIGDWWLCLPVEIQSAEDPAPRDAVGIDLGLKSTATTSDGDALEAGRYYRETEHRIAQAQRRGHKKQAKRLYRKAKRQRADALHKFSRRIVDQYQKIVIGDVSSSSLAKTSMAKSVLDSGWYMLKTQLQYKGQQAGRSVEVVDERYTTRACSDCGFLTGPQGRTGLVVRRWICGECGASHDRDVNAARNILRCAEVSASVCGNEPLPKGGGMSTGAMDAELDQSTERQWSEGRSPLCEVREIPMCKHTPGPVESLARLCIQSDRYRDDADFRDAVDAVLGAPVFDAARDMYAALETTTRELIGERDCLYESVSLADGSIPDGEDQASIAELDRVIDQARSAIKKARGESHD